MSQSFVPGDNLIFQLESGYGVIRVLAVDDSRGERVWHISTFEELFPSVELAESALQNISELHVNNPHLALTDRAFDRTPTAKLNNVAVSDEELISYKHWFEGPEHHVFDRSVLQLLGMR